MEDTPINVPSVSKISTNKKANITTRKLKLIMLEKSSWPIIGDRLAGTNDAAPADKSGMTLYICACGSGVYQPTASQKIAKIQVNKMPQRMLPRTFLTMRTAVNKMPSIASNTVMPTVLNVPEATDCLKENKEILVAGFATIICAFNNPMRAINRPIPADTAFFNVIGMALNKASRTFVRDKIIKIMPSIKTALNAICHV